jgi:hypothetical protein
MRKEAAYAAGIPLFALASSYGVYAVWDQLIRAEFIPNTSLFWFPTAAVVWGCVCIGVGGLLYRADKRKSRRPSRHREVKQ